MATDNHDQEVEAALDEVQTARDLHAAAVRRLLEVTARAMLSRGATEADVRAALVDIAGKALQPNLGLSPGAHVAMRAMLN